MLPKWSFTLPILHRSCLSLLKCVVPQIFCCQREISHFPRSLFSSTATDEEGQPDTTPVVRETQTFQRRSETLTPGVPNPERAYNANLI